nr:hypothetical protein [Tanacetum cinerariifolium]
MTRNVSYLSDFEELNGGYVAFGGNPKGGKITGKGKIKTWLLRVPRENNMYNVNLKNIVPSGDLTCLFAKVTIDESNLWHRRLGHISFKTINKLVKGNLVRGLPTKVFENDHSCVACKKGKQHRSSYKSKLVSSVNQPLFRLHIDLFGPTFVKSLSKKSYCLVITDDYSRFTWVFFLATKDETTPILKTFVTGLENQLSLKVKVIRSDNRTEFKNYDLNQFCGLKGIKGEFSVPRTPQQNGIAERKNRTLIEAARTMLTPYELLHGRTPSIGFMRPFGYPVTILNTLDNLGKFQGKVDEGFLVGYSMCSKAFRVFNSRTRIVQETLHVNFLKNKPNVAGAGPTWLFDIDREEVTQTYVLFPAWSAGSTNPQDNDKDVLVDGKEHEFEVYSNNSSNGVNVASSSVPTAGHNFINSTNNFSAADMPALEDFTYSNDEAAIGAEADINSLESSILVSPIPTIKIHKDHPISQIIGDLSSTTQTRSMVRVVKDQGGLSQMFDKDFHTCMFACFISQEEPKRIHQALKDPSWIDTTQEELLQFKLQKV